MSHRASRYDKSEARENRQRIRAVLNEHSDPIGVARDFEVDDEYDNYVGTVYLMLADDRVSRDDVEKYLHETATGHIGLTPSEDLSSKSAQLPRQS